MELIKAVNTVLRKLGEIPVPSIDEPYPTLATVLAALDEARTRVLKEGWYFNTYYDYTASPDLAGQVILPADTLIFYPDNTDYVFNGHQLRRADNGSLTIGESVKGRLVLDMEFETLPETAAWLITYTAALETYGSDIGEDATWNTILSTAAEYQSTLSAEHTRSRKHNSRNRKPFARWRAQLRT